MSIDLERDFNCKFKTIGNHVFGPFELTEHGYITEGYDLRWNRWGALCKASHGLVTNPEMFTLKHVLQRFNTESKPKERPMSTFNAIIQANKEAAVGAAKARAAQEAIRLATRAVSSLGLPKELQSVISGPFGPLILMNVVAAYAATCENEQVERVAMLGLSVAYQEILTLFLPDLSGLMADLAKIKLPTAE